MAEDYSNSQFQPGPSSVSASGSLSPSDPNTLDETANQQNVVKKPKTEPAKVETKASSSKLDDKELNVAQTALNLLTQGRRHLLVSDIPLAVQTLQEACSLLAEQYGETALECADAYFYYGTALLEMARTDADVLGPGMETDKPADKSDDDECEEENDAEADGEEEEGDSQEDAEVPDEGKGKSIAEPNATVPQQNPNASEDAKSDDEETKEEEVSNLQLAWEMLELAKLIFKRQVESDSSIKPRLADTLLRLAEVSMESENFTAAIEDLLDCLNLQSQIYAPDSRYLAETRYQLGMAYSFANEFNTAISHFKAAAKVIQDRIDNLKKKIEDKANGVAQPEEDAATRNPFYTEQGELEELTSLLPDIQSKVTDTEDLKREAVRKLQEEMGFSSDAASTSKANGNQHAFEAASGSSSSGMSTSTAATPSISDKPVSNISHLVKKKRKPDEGEAEVTKKAKLEEVDK